MKRKIGIYIMCVCIIICVIVTVILAVPSFAVLGEPLLLRWEINNPYVNRNFPEWTYVEIEGFHSFLIPQNWSLQESDGIYIISDESGEVWADGSSKLRNYKDLLERFYNITSAEIEIDTFNQFLTMDGSDIDLLRVHDGFSEKNYFSMQLFETPEKQIIWILVPDIMKNEDQYDVAEAIVYSFAFKKD